MNESRDSEREEIVCENLISQECVKDAAVGSEESVTNYRSKQPIYDSGTNGEWSEMEAENKSNERLQENIDTMRDDSEIIGSNTEKLDLSRTRINKSDELEMDQSKDISSGSNVNVSDTLDSIPNASHQKASVSDTELEKVAHIEMGNEAVTAKRERGRDLDLKGDEAEKSDDRQGLLDNSERNADASQMVLETSEKITDNYVGHHISEVITNDLSGSVNLDIEQIKAINQYANDGSFLAKFLENRKREISGEEGREVKNIKEDDADVAMKNEFLDMMRKMEEAGLVTEKGLGAGMVK